jgi:hypothetical protein
MPARDRASLVRAEAIGFLDPVGRKIVEGPHALVGRRGRGFQGQGGEEGGKRRGGKTHGNSRSVDARQVY